MVRNLGEVSRRELVNALIAVGTPLRATGGEIVIDLPGAHYRFGIHGHGRDASGIEIRRLTHKLTPFGLQTEAFLDRLYGRRKGQRPAVT